MNRKEKEEFVATLKEELSEARSIILANSVGIDANSMNELRAEIRANDSKYRIIKNTLAKLAVEGTDLEMLAEHFTGPTALAYSSEDAVAPAKVLFDYRKDDETLEIRGGYLNGKWMDIDGVEQLSKMPSKDEIRAKLLNAMNGVATKFVRVLNAAPSDFVNVLNARKDSLD